MSRREPVHVLLIDHAPLPLVEGVTAYVDRVGAVAAAQAYADDQRASAGLERFVLDWREDGGGRIVADDVAVEVDFVVYFLELGT